MSKPVPWPLERLEMLSILWMESITTNEIAKRLGVSKGAVCGMARRLDLPMREKLWTRAPARASVMDPPQTRKGRPEPKPIQLIELPYSGPITVFHLKDHHCRWPLGNPHEPDFHFCGATKTDGPYCNKHRSVAYLINSRSPR